MTDPLRARNATQVGTQQERTRATCLPPSDKAESSRPAELASGPGSDAELITLRLGSVSAWPASAIPVAYLTRRLRSHRHWEMLCHTVLMVAVATETALLLIALVPPTEWARLGKPTSPIPATLGPLVAALFYLLPAVTGACCRRWQMAITMAMLPVWLDQGIFVVAASGRTGPFYIIQATNTGGIANTFELFAALGAFGWLVSFALSHAEGWRKLNPLWRISDHRFYLDRVHSDES